MDQGMTQMPLVLTSFPLGDDCSRKGQNSRSWVCWLLRESRKMSWHTLDTACWGTPSHLPEGVSSSLVWVGAYLWCEPTLFLPFSGIGQKSSNFLMSYSDSQELPLTSVHPSPSAHSSGLFFISPSHFALDWYIFCHVRYWPLGSHIYLIYFLFKLESSAALACYSLIFMFSFWLSVCTHVIVVNVGMGYFCVVCGTGSREGHRIFYVILLCFTLRRGSLTKPVVRLVASKSQPPPGFIFTHPSTGVGKVKWNMKYHLQIFIPFGKTMYASICEH